MKGHGFSRVEKPALWDDPSELQVREGRVRTKAPERFNSLKILFWRFRDYR